MKASINVFTGTKPDILVYDGNKVSWAEALKDAGLRVIEVEDGAIGPGGLAADAMGGAPMVRVLGREVRWCSDWVWSHVGIVRRVYYAFQK